MTQKEAIAKAPESRVKRTPVRGKNRLTVSGKEPGYEYRVVNDTDDRVQQFLDGGYELVPNSAVEVGDKRASEGTSIGSAKQISVGGGTKAYVMRIKTEWHKEDQAAKQAEVQALEDATKKKALDGTYGKITIERS